MSSGRLSISQENPPLRKITRPVIGLPPAPDVDCRSLKPVAKGRRRIRSNFRFRARIPMVAKSDASVSCGYGSGCFGRERVRSGRAAAGSHQYRTSRTTQVPIISAFSERLDMRITLTLRVRKKGGLRHTTHTCQAREAIATAKKSGCNRSSHRRQPALINENSPSPNRTCGSIHQLGVSRAATIDNSPVLLGSLFTGRFSRSAL